MTRIATLAAALAVALSAGSAAPAKSDGRLFGIVGTQLASHLVELDPTTLRALPRRRVQIGVGGAPTPWSFDPGRRRLAVAVGQRLRIVDLSKLKVLRAARLGLEARPTGVLWARADRIVVMQRVGGRLEVRTIDAARMTLVSRKRFAAADVMDSERTETGVTLLLAPTGTIGAARLLFVGPAGETQEVELERIRAGMRWDDVDPPVGQQQRPALAAHGDVVYVVSPDGVVAEVRAGLETVRYRTLHGRFSKLLEGASREAFVLGGRLVVSGTNDVASDGVVTSTGIGVDSVELTRWNVTRIASTTSSIAPWRDAVVATGGTWRSDTGHRGTGLAVYGLDGKERLRVLPGLRLWVAAIHGERAYAYVDGPQARLAVVNLVSGAVELRANPSLPWLLLEQGSPVA